MNLGNVSHIIDVEYFTVQSMPVAKELGIIDIKTGQLTSYYYKVGSFSKLNSFDRTNAIWLKNNIHGLLFRDELTDYPQINICEHIKTIDNLNVVAYKGGEFEKQLLDYLGIANVNLEAYNCPRYDQLVEHYNIDAYNNEQCSRHVCRNVSNKKLVSKYLHCPRIELLYYRHWFLEYAYNTNND